jgi:hypothetical protein
MQLVAYGAQDVYLTGEPQITFFKVVYRRHTNFSVEPIVQTFSGASDFGRTVTCNINRNGDLIGKMYVVADLDAKTGTNWGYVSRLGHALIESAKVEIGGSKIDEHYGDWLNIWHELSRNTSHDRGYDRMIGNVPELTKVGGDKSSYRMYVPLQFWFNRNNGLALPLIALQYHDVRMTIKFRDANSCVNYTGASVTNGPSMKDATLLIDYIYLDTEERKRFAQAQHEYLIEQLQFTGSEAVSSKNNKYRLNFNHPSKFLVWAHQMDAVRGQKFIDWAHDGNWEAALERAAKKIWNAVNVAAAADGDNVASLNEAINSAPRAEATAGALALAAKVTALPTKTAALVNDWEHVQVIGHSLTVDDLSTVLAGVDMVTVNDHFNYTNNVKGEGNPVDSARLQLNGHERFTERDGAYFNYVQPHQHFTCTPADGVNVYSFALEPEKHQPSGTCNFSRIDNTTLNVNLTETPGANDTVNIYTVNYNVLRVMSGMAGVAYSN